MMILIVMMMMMSIIIITIINDATAFFAGSLNKCHWYPRHSPSGIRLPVWMVFALMYCKKKLAGVYYQGSIE